MRTRPLLRRPAAAAKSSRSRTRSSPEKRHRDARRCGRRLRGCARSRAASRGRAEERRLSSGVASVRSAPPIRTGSPARAPRYVPPASQLASSSPDRARVEDVGQVERVLVPDPLGRQPAVSRAAQDDDPVGLGFEGRLRVLAPIAVAKPATSVPTTISAPSPSRSATTEAPSRRPTIAPVASRVSPVAPSRMRSQQPSA